MRLTRATTVLFSLATLCAACGGGGPKSPPPGEPAAKTDVAPSTAPAAPANPLANLGPLGSLLADKLDAPGPYDPPRQSPDFEAGKPHWLTLDLTGEIGELAPMSLFGGGSVIELHTLLQRLDKLAADDNVQGLLVRFTDVQLNMATAEEVRGALLAFKAEGKRKLACHADGPVGAVYYLMSACDTIGVQPLGDVMIPGPMALPVHLRGLLDKLGVVPDFVHVGAYKGAADALTRTQPTPEMRETLSAVVDQAYLTMQTGIAEGRNLPPETIAQRIDAAAYTADSALTAGLIDGVATYEEFRTQHTSGLPWKQVKLKDSPSGGFDAQKLQAFLGLAPVKRPSEPHVALVYALGGIVDGRGQGILGARQQIAGRTLSAAIDNLAADPAVAAIVLRVDSPGGSAMASEQIWRALQRARENNKPIVVSMGGVAASGGYYISCGATKIFALANTLTGSIGVIGGKIAVGDALARLGVQTFPITRGKRAAMWSPMSPWTADERQSVLHMMEEVYRVFVSRVAAGRDKTTDEIHAVAQGRVWTGAAALERGLVDELGGLHAALAEARKLANIGPEVALEVYPPEPTLKDILEGFDPSPSLIRAALGEGHLVELAAALGVAGTDVIAGALAQLESFAAEPVQTAMFWPVVVR